MKYTVRFTEEASDDLERLYLFQLERDIDVADRALNAIMSAIALLEFSPFTCRKARGAGAFVREIVIPFGATGYLALFEIEPDYIVTITAVRHQREEDYQ
jgi:plasmid stabilization system protein ParE